MIYTVERANLLAEQFRRFKSGHAHHLAGLFANVEFWLREVEEAFRTIDEYGVRFVALRTAQEDWVSNFEVREHKFCPICSGACEFADVTPAPPQRTSSGDLSAARHGLKEEARGFLLRCYRVGLLDEAGLRAMCTRLGTGLEPSELER